jgi:hypothetical protein
MNIIQPNIPTKDFSIHLKDLKIMKMSMEKFIDNFLKKKNISFHKEKIKNERVILDRINESIRYFESIK